MKVSNFVGTGMIMTCLMLSTSCSSTEDNEIVLPNDRVDIELNGSTRAAANSLKDFMSTSRRMQPNMLTTSLIYPVISLCLHSLHLWYYL